ncbi:MAG TPA: hypothetical protein VMF55_03130 [Solirubrobacterales bacterium]|nr:hypothetical protein [Solirubrobacterales bacterium]
MLRLLRRILARWEVEVGESTYFAESRAERLARLQTDDPQVAREILEEARRLNDGVSVSAEGVERRATTLQGVVSIAATLAVAAGALLLDPTKVHGIGWRLALATLFACLLYCFIATAFRATQSSSWLHQWTHEDPADHLARTSASQVEVDTGLSADILYSYGRNMEVVRWKVSYLGAATEWFLRGLIFLGLIAITFCLYICFHRGETVEGEEGRRPLVEVNVIRAAAGLDHKDRHQTGGPESGSRAKQPAR